MKRRITSFALFVIFTLILVGSDVALLPKEMLVYASPVVTIRDEEKFNSEIFNMVEADDDYYSKIIVDVKNNTITRGDDEVSLSKYGIDYSRLESTEMVIPTVAVLDTIGYSAAFNKDNTVLTVSDGEDTCDYEMASDKLVEAVEDEDSFVRIENGVAEYSDNGKTYTELVGYMDEDEADERFNLSAEYNDGKIIITNKFQTKRLIVQVDSSKKLADTYGAVRTITDGNGFYVLQYESEDSARNAYDKFEKLSGVTVHSDEIISTSAISERSGAKLIQSDRYKVYLKNNNKTAQIKVAVVDSGVDVNHSFLKNRITGGYDYVAKKSKVTDPNGHGTHVAGIIADNTPSNVKIMPVRVMNEYGEGTTLTIKAGIDYAVKNGARVINLSLGGNCATDDCPMAQAIKTAVSKKVVVIAAAGNESSDTKNICPARLTNCITVAATSKDGSSVTTFSNYGSSVDVSAPGLDILSCQAGGGYVSMDGTSMAAPFVSAAAAMLVVNDSSVTPAQVKTKLKSSCSDMLLSGWDKYSGSGVINFGIMLGDKKKSASEAHIGIADLSMRYFSKATHYLPNTTVDSEDFTLTDRSFTTSTTNSKVAVYDGKYIIPKGPGKATITLTAPSGYKSTCQVTITKKEVWIDYAASSYAAGNGTKTSPYQIKTAQQLAKFALDMRNGVNSKGKYYKMMNDIDLKGKYWISAVDMHDVGGYNSVWNFSGSFKGVFDGGNHKIKNMTVFNEELDASWFDMLPYNKSWYAFNSGFMGGDFEGTLKNLGIENAYSASNNESGLLAGNLYTGSQISNCYTTGFTTGNGLFGAVMNYDIVISNCFSSASCLGAGIASTVYSSGMGKVRLNNVFFCGEYLSSDSVNGNSTFVSSVYGNDTYFYNCFNASKAVSQVGFAAENERSNFSKCYYLNSNKYGLKKSKGSSTKPAAKNASFFKTKSTYTTASNWNSTYKWDFDKVWAIDKNVNNGYPYLKNNKPLTTRVALSDYWKDYATAKYAGGSGTSKDPYLISTPAQLAKLSRDYQYGGGQGLYFRITKDIDMSAHLWSPIGSGIRIDSQDGNFDGIFKRVFFGRIDGLGHTISNLRIESNGDDIGFISVLHEGSVHRLNFANASVKGHNRVGIVCGTVKYKAMVANCKLSSGTVNGNSEIGSVSGAVLEGSDIANISSSVKITAKEKCGGITSDNSGLIQRCAFTGEIELKDKAMGSCGGIACLNYGEFLNSYSTCKSDYRQEYSGGKVTSCYNIYKDNLGSPRIQIYGKSFKQTDIELSEVNDSSFSDFDFTNIWIKNENDLPTLKGYTFTRTSFSYPSDNWANHRASSFAGGNGTKNNPYLIATAGQLAYMPYFLVYKNTSENMIYFRLINNINLDGKLWSFYTFNGGYFDLNFTFDGNNKTISNVIMKNGSGFFACASCGTIKNLTLKNVKGTTCCGLVAYNKGTVTNCYVSGSFSFSTYNNSAILECAGIAAENYGTITKSGVNCNIEGGASQGMLVGRNCGTITNCYAFGSMKSDVRNMFSNASREECAENCYGVVSCYYNPEDENDKPYGKNCYSNYDNLDLKKKETFKGWNFDSVWAISSDVNNGYPYIRQPQSYAISYNLKGGTNPKYYQKDYVTGQTVALPAPTRRFFVFKGWYEKSNYSGSALYSLSSSYKKNVSLYAKWAAGYEVAFNSNYGKNSKVTQNIQLNTSTALKANSFKRDGYTFAGWATSKKGKVVYKNKQSVKNIAKKGKMRNLYAVWTPNKYTVRYYGNGAKGGSVANQSFTYGKKQALNANKFTAPKGKVFSGWSTKKGATPIYTNKQSVSNLTTKKNGSVSLYANWITPKTYKITYKVNGGKLPENYAKTYKSGTGCKLPTPTRKGYKFKGWYTSSKFSSSTKVTTLKPWISGNKTLYAKWSK